MNDKQKELITHLQNNFGFNLACNTSEVDTESAFFKYVQRTLGQRIEFFINTDMDKLLHILYRIDIKERDSGAAFDLGKIEDVSMKLAELIIVRQLQKIDYSRKFYSADFWKEKE